MKILLLNPDTENINLLTPPLGLCYLAGMLKKRGYNNIVGIDLHVDEFSKLEKEVKDADIVGIQTMSKAFSTVIEISKKLKEINPKVKICLGGPHPSLEPYECMNEKVVDFIIGGEGEYPFFNLVSALDNGKSFEGIKGLYYRKDGKVIDNGNFFINNLDEYPFPDYDAFDFKKFTKFKFMTIISLSSSRSCPNVCTNCQPALRKIAGYYRQRSVDNVIEEIKFMKKKYGARLFGFIDNTFTINYKWVEEFCEKVKKLNIIWSGAATIKTVDKKLLQKMKDANCAKISFGVESGSQRVLDEVLNKNITAEKARNVIKWCNEVGLRTNCWFMIGIPGETKEEMMETVEMAKTIGANSVMFSVGVPQPHIKWNEMFKDYIIPHNLLDLEKPGQYKYNLFGDDPWFGKTSLFQTPEWGPDFIELVKQKIVNDFVEMGWRREEFYFIDVKRESERHFKEFVGSELFSFFNDKKYGHIKMLGKAFFYKTKYILRGD